MRRKQYVSLLLLVVSGFLALLLLMPMFLRTLPSRYLAYAAEKLPVGLQEPFNQLVLPQQEVAILPTAVVPIDTQALLAVATPSPTATAVEAVPAPTLSNGGLPVTFTPLPNTEVAIVPTETATAVPPTPTPTVPPPPTATPLPFPSAARINGIYHIFQTWNNCGPATMAMTMSYFGMQVSQVDAAKVMKPDVEDRNVTPTEMVGFVNNHTPYQAITRVNGDLDTIKRFLANGIPVILEIGLEAPGDLRWMGWYGHYMLVVAYDDELQRIWVYDSWLGTGTTPLENADPSGRALSYADVARDWAHFNRNYIAIYSPEQAQLVADIIGQEVDDEVMWQNSLTQAQQDAQSDPENAFYWFNLGTSLNAAQQYEAAAMAFDQARAIGLPWRMLWYQFGPYQAYYEVGRYDDVLLLTETTLKDRPYFEESFYYKGLALAAQGDLGNARDNLQKAINFNPNFLPAQDAITLLESGS